MTPGFFFYFKGPASKGKKEKKNVSELLPLPDLLAISNARPLRWICPRGHAPAPAQGDETQARAAKKPPLQAAVEPFCTMPAVQALAPYARR